MIGAVAIEFYVNDKGAEYNKHDWVEKIHEKSIVRVDKKYILDSRQLITRMAG